MTILAVVEYGFHGQWLQCYPARIDEVTGLAYRGSGQVMKVWRCSERRPVEVGRIIIAHQTEQGVWATNE